MHPSRQINSSIYHSEQLQGEQYTGELLFSYQIYGKLEVEEGGNVQDFPPGTFRLVRRNKLLKFKKIPGKGGIYQSLTVVFHSEMLRAYADAHGYRARYQSPGPAVIKLSKLPLYRSLAVSLEPFTIMDESLHRELIQMKIKETLMTLLKEQNELQQYIFDFSEPVKADISRFMNDNFRHNLPLSRFAYLSGRSLASYKRDFKKVFKGSPGSWLLERRLVEASRLLAQPGVKPSRIYQELGFEDLSHFSRAFKKRFGFPPSKFPKQASVNLNPD